MELSVAVSLIENGIGSANSQRWADLGAGTGLFTTALASRLTPPSVVYAVDRDEKAIGQIPAEISGNTVRKVTSDFRDVRRLPGVLDGVLFANSLHFVKEKVSFLEDLKQKFTSSGRVIIVEYDLEKPNPWVPYPLRVEALEKLLVTTGFSNFRKLHRHPSRYNRADIYSAVAHIVGERFASTDS
jgi:SAM-dependent methyltransferase